MQEKKKIIKKYLPQRKIKVGKHTWTVYAVPVDYPDLGKNNWGRAILEKREILILDSLKEKTFKETLAHELLHASFHEVGFHTKLLRLLKTKKNEELVDKLADTLCNTLIKKSLFYLKAKTH